MDFKKPEQWQAIATSPDITNITGQLPPPPVEAKAVLNTDPCYCKNSRGSVKLATPSRWYAYRLEGLAKNTDYFLRFSYLAPALVKGVDYILASAGIFNYALADSNFKTNTDIDNIGYLHVVTPFGNMNSKNGLGTGANRHKEYARNTREVAAGVWQDMTLHFHSGEAPDTLALMLYIKSPEVYLDDFALIAVPAPAVARQEYALPSICGKTGEGPFATRTGETTVYSDCTGQDFEAYLAALNTAGFACHSTHRLEENRFALYTKGNTLAYIAYYPANGTLRITAQTVDALPAREGEQQFQGDQQPLLIQLNHINRRGGGIGMSYAIRLADGSFMMVDGGDSEYKLKQVEILYRTLREYQPTGKLRFAAWLITHPHSDHFGCFNTFVEVYHDEIEVEQLIYNFPTDAGISESRGAHYLFYGYNSLPIFEMNVRHYLPHTKISTAHTGYTYHIRNAVITVLHTMEDLFPAQLPQYKDINDTCMVFKIGFTDAGVDQEILITGDIAGRSWRDLFERYSEATLACYFVQVIHHGIGYGSAEFYAKTKPTVALWPASDHRLHEVLCQPQNRYFEAEDGVREIVLSDFGTRVFALPYAAPSGLIGLAKFTLPDKAEELNALIRYLGPRFDPAEETPVFRLDFAAPAEVLLARTVSGHTLVEYGLLLDCGNTEWIGTEGAELLPTDGLDSFGQKLVAYHKTRGTHAVERYDPYLGFEDEVHCSTVFTCRPLAAEQLAWDTGFRVRAYAYFENSNGERLCYLGDTVTETMRSALQAVAIKYNPQNLPEIIAQQEYAKQFLEQRKA